MSELWQLSERLTQENTKMLFVCMSVNNKMTMCKEVLTGATKDKMVPDTIGTTETKNIAIDFIYVGF